MSIQIIQFIIGHIFITLTQDISLHKQMNNHKQNNRQINHKIYIYTARMWGPTHSVGRIVRPNIPAVRVQWAESSETASVCFNEVGWIIRLSGPNRPNRPGPNHTSRWAEHVLGRINRDLFKQGHCNFIFSKQFEKNILRNKCYLHT